MSARAYCERCHRPQLFCYCAQISVLHNRWPVHILQHPRESRHALGTARIAHLGLAACSVSVGDAVELPKDTVLIYPGEHSLPLSTLHNHTPRTLLFLDATWRKSRRMIFESPTLAALPRYALESPPPGRYRIRKEPDAHALSTLEAIVHTLSALEDNKKKYAPLLKVMDDLIQQHIDFMGQETFEKNYSR